MTQRKAISTLAVPADPVQIADRLNRELVPKLRQLSAGTAVTGSVSGATLTVLAELIVILDAAGIITNKTTP